MDSVLDFKTDLFSSVEFPFCPDVSSQGSLRSDKMVLEKTCDKFQDCGYVGYHKGTL